MTRSMHDTPAPAWRVLALLAAWLLVSAGWRPLLLPDEGRYAGVAFEMLAGSPLVPTLNGLPYFHKPPLLYWLDMAAMSVFGVNAFAVRLGPALLGWLLGAATYLHLRHAHGETPARVGLAVLATMPLFFFGAQYVNHDIGVAACITAAVFSAVHALDDPVRPRRRWVAAAWAFCALGVLAKGLIGLVLPALVVGPWLLAQRRGRALLALLHPAGLLTFALVALPWMLAMQQRFPAFFDYFIVEQHLRRYAETGFNNRQPFWFYAAALPLLALPWSGWLWPAARAVRMQARPYGALYAWWIVAIVGFFSLPASKLVGYVMPALAPLAALLGVALVARGTPWRRVAAAAGGVGLVGVAVLAWQAPGSQRDVGAALGERWRAGDRLVFADQPYFDLRFYARVSAPAIVLADWDDAALPRRDDWHKELFDAGRFADAAARERLWPWARVGELGCGAGRLWVVADRAVLPRLLALPDLRTVFEGRHALLLSACDGAPR